MNEGHILVSVRMIGHQLLLSSGDSHSRVLPILKVGDRYQLQFASEFSFEPDTLIHLVDSVVQATSIAERYLVEVEQCNSGEVVYSYEKGNEAFPGITPCSGRSQPRDCYILYLTILESRQATALPAETQIPSQPYPWWPILVAIGLLVAGAIWWRINQPQAPAPVESNFLQIGAYQFDPRSLELHFQDQTTALTGKEAELLALLHASLNQTLERDDILKAVWGNDGGYIGRTLDVFISKLRKRLASDERVKILNIRGVGYRLVVE